MLIWPILSSLIKIFIMIIPGIFFRKKNYITDNQNEGITSIVVNLTWPCLVIDAMQMEFNSQVLRDSLYILVLAAVIFIVVGILSLLISSAMKLSHTKQFLTIFMLVFGNTGFIGIPVINALYGGEAIFYSAIVELINDVLLFTVGILLIQLSAGAKLKMDPKQFLSPGFVGVLIGLVLFILNIQLPSVIGDTIATIGNATTPLTMFAIGVQLAGMKIREITGDWKVYAITAIKLLIVPLVALLIVKLWAGDFTLLEKVLVISFAMPVASCASIFSQQYKGEAAFATKTVLISTVSSIVAIPIFAIIMEL